MRRAGLALGIAIVLASSACVSVSVPSASPAPTESAPPTGTLGTPSPNPTARPSAAPTATPKPTAAPTATPTATHASSMGIVGRIVNAEQGYAITLPATWLRLDLESGLAQFIAAAAVADPAIADLCESGTPEELEACLEQEAAEVQAGFAVLTDLGAQLAMDLATIDKPFPTLVVIYSETGLTGVTPELLLSIGPATLRAGGIVGRIQSGLLEVPAGTAAYFYYAMPADQVPNARARQFHLLDGDTGYTVIVAAHKSEDGLAEDADALIQSFEILP